MMEGNQQPEPPKLPRFEDFEDLVELDSWVDIDEETESDETEDTDVTYDTHTTVAFVCLSCGYTKFIHYWRNDPDGLDKARQEYEQLHGAEHAIIWTEYVFEE